MVRRIEFRQQFNILVLFMIVQFAGLLLSSMVYTSMQITPNSNAQNNSQINTPSQALWFFVYLILATLIILLFFKFYHGNILYRLLEGFVIVVPSFFVFATIFGYFFPNASIVAVSLISLLISICLVVSKNKYPQLKNTVVIIASIGVGLVLGIEFGFSIAYLLVLAIAAYDYISVFITKHMITLAKAATSKNLAFLIGSTDVEVIPRGFFNKKESKEYMKYKKELEKSRDPIIKKIMKQGKLPLISQVQLGAGDLGIPLMLAISSYRIAYNYFIPVSIAIGGTLGMLFTMYVQKKYLIPLPAIPPLFSFMSLVLGLAFLTVSIKFGIFFMLMGILILSIFMFGVKRSAKNNR